MAKRFKLRLSKVITSFNSCRSKDTSTLPFNPTPSFHSPTTTPPLKPPQNPHRSSLRHHVSSALISVGCGIKSRPTLSEDEHNKSPPETFHWKKENNYHVVAKAKLYYDETTPRRKIYTTSSDNDILPPPPPTPSDHQKKKRRALKKKKTTCRFRTSTSSAESGLFSGEETETETETLVSSSRSFSTDSSSEFNPHLKTIREATVIDCSRRSFEKIKRSNRRKRSVKKGAKRCVSNKTYLSGLSTPQENETEARLSVFQTMIPCTVDGKVRESYAVVKKSEDPHEDFKRSMIEMIVEKQMFDDEDLEKLLQCFLSLNSRRHHGVIVQAFTEIWEILFCSKSKVFKS